LAEFRGYTRFDLSLSRRPIQSPARRACLNKYGLISNWVILSHRKEDDMKTAEDIVKDKLRDIVYISWDQTIYQACQKMTENKIGAILVKKDDKIIGIWTERDLLRNITVENFDPKTSKVGDYMTTPLHTASYDTHIHKLEEMLLGLFIRHLIIEKDGKHIGLISIGDVLRASLLEKDRQFAQLNAFVNWEYYENWKWGRKKKK
jgi:signal-transduction protein with cAMP-binding, CBS, and nucleotidyltransferase domain